MIRVEGLRVRFGERLALDDISFAASAGEIVGLLGPNGAGKTTTLSVLATLRGADAGLVEVAGHSVATDAAAVRRVLGLVPQTLAIYPTLTARENLRFFARILGLRRGALREAVTRALEMVGLEERSDDVVSTFSGGMQRRLNLACGLMHSPRVVLLDEPTVGVDPQSRERIFTAVRAQAAAGAAVIYSTHYMEEAERLCDRVVLVDRGHVVATGAPAELIHAATTGLRLEVVTRTVLPVGWHDGVAGARPFAGPEPTARIARGNRVSVVVEGLAAAPRILERAAALGGEVLEFHVQRTDLQSVFLSLTGHDLRD